MISRRMQVVLAVLVFSALALAYYGLRLKRRAEELRTPVADTAPMTPPVSGPAESARLFVADDREGTIHERQVSLALPAAASARAQTLLRALTTAYLGASSTHPLGGGADIRSVYFINETLAVVDANAAFADRHRSGALVEELTIASFIQTLAATFPNVTQVKFLVDGKERETLAGHVDLKAIYDVGAVTQLVRELQ